jgi:DNA-binding MarR family transcriptional regulator
MTRLVAAMERDGLVRRHGDASDARAVRLEPTARGRRLLHAGRRRRINRLSAAISARPAGDADLLERAAAIIEALARGC